MPLAFTQEDFLVLDILGRKITINKDFDIYIFDLLCPRKEVPASIDALGLNHSL